jgi:hypothetical protein
MNQTSYAPVSYLKSRQIKTNMSKRFHGLSKFLLSLSCRQACAFKIWTAKAGWIDNFLAVIDIGTNFAYKVRMNETMRSSIT